MRVIADYRAYKKLGHIKFKKSFKPPAKEGFNVPIARERERESKNKKQKLYSGDPVKRLALLAL